MTLLISINNHHVYKTRMTVSSMVNLPKPKSPGGQGPLIWNLACWCSQRQNNGGKLGGDTLNMVAEIWTHHRNSWCLYHLKMDVIKIYHFNFFNEFGFAIEILNFLVVSRSIYRKRGLMGPMMGLMGSKWSYRSLGIHLFRSIWAMA